MVYQQKGKPNPNCNHGDLCIGYTEPNEKLTGTFPSFSCIKNGNCKLSAAGLSEFKSAETFSANYYYINNYETIGMAQNTAFTFDECLISDCIGYGHDCNEQKDCTNIHETLSLSQGLTLLAKDMGQFEKCVGKLPNTAELNPNQFSALISFAYNSGCGGVSKYFKSFMTKKDFKDICTALPKMNAGKNKLTDGLLARRKKEAALCSTPTTTTSGC